MSETFIPSLSRRDFLGAVAISPFTALAAQAAGTNLERLMVQGRPQDTGSPYKYDNIMRALDGLGGVRKMRCRAPFSRTAGWNTYSQLARAGVRFSFTLTTRDPMLTVADLVLFETENSGAIWAIEFPNEPDLNPVTYNGAKDKRLGARTGDAPALMAFCQDIKNLIEKSPRLAHIPVIAFNDWMQDRQSTLVKYANSHIYPRPQSPPNAWLREWRGKVKQSGQKQGVITEWGRSTGGGPKNVVSPPVSLEQQADLLKSDLISIFSEPSVATVSIYELLCWPGSGEQENFGLFEIDMSPRPAVAAIRSILI